MLPLSQIYIRYITDRRPGEQDILAPHKNACLVIRSLDGTELHRQAAPENGWTHDGLVKVQPPGIEGGADAWLDECWAGSTEV